MCIKIYKSNNNAPCMNDNNKMWQNIFVAYVIFFFVNNRSGNKDIVLCLTWKYFKKIEFFTRHCIGTRFHTMCVWQTSRWLIHVFSALHEFSWDEILSLMIKWSCGCTYEADWMGGIDTLKLKPFSPIIYPHILDNDATSQTSLTPCC